MNRIEIDVITGERKVIELTAEEIAQAQIQHQAWLAEEEAIKAAQPTKEEQIARLQEQLAALQEQLK
jgi:hypothetical protein